TVLERHTPELIHRVFSGEHRPHSRPERRSDSEHERKRITMKRPHVQLMADHRKLAKGRPHYSAFEGWMSTKHEPQCRGGNEQEREDREEAVVGDRRG